LVELNLAQLLKDISSNSPCGENLEEDAVFLTLQDEARFVEERQMGDSVIPAEEPDWKVVRNLALELLERTRDIQVAMHLTSALVRTDGFHGLEQGLTLLKEWLKKYWDSVYPVQDPEDDYPILRINTLSSLNDYTLFRKALNHIALTQSALGDFSWQDIEIAEGKKPAPSEVGLPEMSLIEAAFNETDLVALQKLGSSIKQALQQVKEISKIIIEKVDAINTPDLSALTHLLQSINGFVAEKIQQRQEVEGAPGDLDAGDAAESMPVNSLKSIKSKQAGIHSRNDVIQAIDEMCKYFDRYEPSSPVPFLLLRAKKLLAMNFMDILRDMTPDAVNQAENICGIKKDQEN
jgi:type VI secretion system protein ImpA